MHAPHQPEQGWPLWALGAVAPVVLALGFVGGMALATFGGWQARPAMHTVAKTARPVPAQFSSPPQATSPSARSYTPTALDFRRTAEPGDRYRPLPSPGGSTDNTTKPRPPATTSTPAEPKLVRDVREARQELARSYGQLDILGAAISGIDYQQMRNTGSSISLVGMIRVSAYDAWASARRNHPDELKAWLEQAAQLVQTAATRDRFWLSWAVVDVVSQRPDGYADYEVTPLANGSYLVIRPLAATADPASASVSLRPDTVPTTADGRPALANSPWATYGPAIRFDSTDLYRPGGLTNTKPR